MFSEPLVGAGLLGEDHAIETGDGRWLRAMVGGSGPDLVVLEGGLGVSGLYWGSVHERVARHARVVAYERAGFNGSDSDPGVRDLARLADDLETVIDRFPCRRLVLVGHSWGGPIVRAVAARRVENGRSLSGLVLVDQSDEHADVYFSRLVGWQFAAQAALMVPLARLKLLAPLSRGSLAGLPGVLRTAAATASSSINAARATAAEQRHVVRGLSDLRANPPALGDTPVCVLSGALAGALRGKSRAALVQAHRTTALAHPRWSFVSATRSEHMIPVTEPELIATNIINFMGVSPTATGTS